MVAHNGDKDSFESVSAEEKKGLFESILLYAKSQVLCEMATFKKETSELLAFLATRGQENQEVKAQHALLFFRRLQLDVEMMTLCCAFLIASKEVEAENSIEFLQYSCSSLRLVLQTISVNFPNGLVLNAKYEQLLLPKKKKNAELQKIFKTYIDSL
jgi:hypothetical protein